MYDLLASHMQRMDTSAVELVDLWDEKVRYITKDIDFSFKFFTV